MCSCRRFRRSNAHLRAGLVTPLLKMSFYLISLELANAVHEPPANDHTMGLHPPPDALFIYEDYNKTLGKLEQMNRM